jgi:para-nitrobenzyl esterase
MIGSTREETGSFFASNATVFNENAQEARAHFDQQLGAKGAARYGEFADRRVQGSPYAALVDLTSNTLFRQPSIWLAPQLTESGGSVFAYRVDFNFPQPHVGTRQCYELPLFFGNFDQWYDAPMIAGLDREKARLMSSRVKLYLLNFIHNGTTNSSTSPMWHLGESNHLECLHFDEVITWLRDTVDSTG